MEINKKLLFITLILFVVFILSLKKSFLIGGTFTIILGIFSFYLLKSKRKNKEKLYVGGIILLLFVWLFSLVYNVFMKNKKVVVDTFSGKGSKNSNKKVLMSEKDYEELFFVFKTLMNIDHLDIRTIILENKITNVYQLSDIIIKNNNKKKLYRLNIRLQTDPVTKNVTLIKHDASNKGSIEDFSKNKKMQIFAQLLQVPTFSIDLIVKLINKENITKVDSTNYKNVLEKLNKDNLNKPIEKSGFEYKLGLKEINDSYLDFLSYIFSDLSEINSKTMRDLKFFMNPALENSSLTLRQKINVTFKTPSKLVKELSTIFVLFDHYEMINNVDLIELTDLIKNRELIKTKPWTDTNKDAIRNINKSIDSIFISNMNTYDLENDIFNIDVFTDYRLKERIIDKMNQKRKDEMENKLINFGEEPEKEEEENKNTQYEKFLKRNEYITLENLNDISNKREVKKIETNAYSIFNIRENFANTINKIIEEMTNLINNPSNEFVDYDKLSTNSYIDKYLFYFKNVLVIITREGRLIYSGMLLLLLAILVFFIEISSY